MDILIEVLGYIGALFISVAFLPQTYKLFKTKDTKGLSLICYLIYQFGLTFFIIYASFIKDYPLLGANAFAWIINICLLFLISYNLYSKNNNKNKNNKKNLNGKSNATH